MIAKTHPDFPSDICLLLSTLNAKLSLMNAKRKTEMLGPKYSEVTHFLLVRFTQGMGMGELDYHENNYEMI